MSPKKKKKKKIDRTKFGDYSSKKLNKNGIIIHSILTGIGSILILIHGVYSIIDGKAAVPTRHRIQFINGIPMYILLGSLSMIILYNIIPILQYFKLKNYLDQNENEIIKKYTTWKKRIKFIGWTLFILSVVMAHINDNVIR